MPDAHGSTGASLIMTTVGSDDQAARIAGALVERREAACVQQLAIKSNYRWEGEVRRDTEILLLVKTSNDAADAAMQTIRRLHDYDVPEVVALPVVGGLPEYLAWIDNETTGGGDD